MLIHRPTSRRPASSPVADEAERIGSFRYRTALFVGAWRDHSEEAVDGAGDRLAIRWLVKGKIEARPGTLSVAKLPKAH